MHKKVLQTFKNWTSRSNCTEWKKCVLLFHDSFNCWVLFSISNLTQNDNIKGHLLLFFTRNIEKTINNEFFFKIFLTLLPETITNKAVFVLFEVPAKKTRKLKNFCYFIINFLVCLSRGIKMSAIKADCTLSSSIPRGKTFASVSKLRYIFDTAIPKCLIFCNCWNETQSLQIRKCSKVDTQLCWFDWGQL